jgi:hypothetical protein
MPIDLSAIRRLEKKGKITLAHNFFFFLELSSFSRCPLTWSEMRRVNKKIKGEGEGHRIKGEREPEREQ